MKAAQEANRLTTPQFLAEIHHLLWIDPFDNQGTWDEGWNCRDHAWLGGVVLQLLGLTAAVVYGEAMFVRGPDGDAPPTGLSQTGHAWLGIDGLGFMDISPNLAQCRELSLQTWQLKCIAMNRCIPDGRFENSNSSEDYERRVGIATNTPGNHAVYFGRGYDNIDSDFVNQAFQFINSPLSVRLATRFEPDVYAKAAIHLFKILSGKSQSLQKLSQDQAWECISTQPGNAIAWLKMKGAIR